MLTEPMSHRGSSIAAGESPQQSNPIPITLLLLCMLSIVLVYGASAEVFTQQEVSDYYARMGRGFLAGHLHLVEKPSAEVLALSNPYNPSLRKGVDYLYEASLYNGKYYFYYGATPAVTLWIPAYKLTGISISDRGLASIFATLGTIALLTLLFRFVRRQNIESRLCFLIAALSVSFCTFVPLMLRRPFFYETAIAGAYCYSALGLLCLWSAYHGAKYASLLRALSGLSFGLAAGSRIFHGGAIVIIAAAWLWAFKRRTRSQNVRDLLWMVAPWSAVIGAIFAYNFARFGSLFEAGMRYSLTMVDFHYSVGAYWNASFVFGNIKGYLLRPIPWNLGLLWKQDLGAAYITLSTFGLITNSPFVLWCTALSLKFKVFWKPLEESWGLLFGVAIYGAGMMAVILSFQLAIFRYSVDFAPWIMLLAAIAFLQHWRNATESNRRYILLGGGILAGGSLILHLIAATPPPIVRLLGY